MRNLLLLAILAACSFGQDYGNQLHIPAIVTGDGWVTTITFTNEESRPAQVDLEILDDQGQPSCLPTPDGCLPTLQATLAANQSVTFKAGEDVTPLRFRSARVVSFTNRVKAVVTRTVLTYALAPTPDDWFDMVSVQSGVVDNAEPPSIKAFRAFDNTNSKSQMAFIFNPGHTESAFTLTFFNQNGVDIYRVDGRLAAGATIKIDTDVSQLEEQQGTVRLQSVSTTPLSLYVSSTLF